MGIASLISGLITHFASYFSSQSAWQNCTIAHVIINIAILGMVAIHVKQHWGWFKGLIKKPSFTKKIAFFITFSFIAVCISGIITLLFANIPNTHKGLIHFGLGLLFSLLVIIHFISRWKVFSKGIGIRQK